MSPFLRLRNIPEVRVFGAVTTDWAKYLERVMMGGEGAVERFERTEEGWSQDVDVYFFGRNVAP